MRRNSDFERFITICLLSDCPSSVAVRRHLPPKGKAISGIVLFSLLRRQLPRQGEAENRRRNSDFVRFITNCSLSDCPSSPPLRGRAGCRICRKRQFGKKSPPRGRLYQGLSSSVCFADSFPPRGSRESRLNQSAPSSFAASSLFSYASYSLQNSAKTSSISASSSSGCSSAFSSSPERR